MNSAGNDATHKSLLKSALLALDDMQAKLDAAQRARHAPIAVVGMGCRFPGGADDPDAYWKLLLDGVDAVREAPPERWSQEELADPDVPGPWYGGFLDKVDQFDAQFFGISPREAGSMDPQQRLVLEVGWEALENAGLAPDQLVGSQTGVFLGITTNDYGYLLRKGGSALLNAYAATGSALNAAAGRLAFTLGLQGPTVAVDTACSSSLVAIHLACQSLRSGECDMALTGGVNLALSLEGFICSARWGMLAPDGRCKTFDADADGFVRGEGCGIVVLKRLEDAAAAGDRILAVIRGSAINQDGRSSGLTVPNGLAQQAVIRKALADAGVQPAQIGYVETHGTGTAIGDPIEVEALGAVLGEGRTQPLVIGSVKTNLGHGESAAGVAALIKVILSLQHGTIPPHLHFHERSPRIPWPDFPLEIPTAPMAWEGGAQGRLAGISGFGFSGTNAHLVVGEAPPAAAASGAAPAAEGMEPGAERPVHLLTLSAPNKTALGELAARFAAHIDLHPEQSLADLTYTANVGRAQFAQRLSVVAGDKGTLQARLRAASNTAEGRQGKGVQIGTAARGGRPRLAWLFSGHGGQYAGMGRQLYATQPVFRAAFDRCDALFRAYLPQSLADVVGLAAAPAANGANGANGAAGAAGAAGADGWMQSMTYSQPALFALQVALAELWRSWGIQPSAVLGHSLGQYAAAYAAGVFSLEDAVKLVAARSRLMDGLGASGMMVAVFAGEEQVKEAVAPYAEQVAVAVYNGPQHFVVSGASEAVEKLVQDLGARKIETRRLVVGQASHSPLMAPILDEFERIAAGIQLRKPQLRLISNVSGLEAGDEIATARYWRDHLAQPVRFADSLRTLQELRYQHFLEIGPQPMLIGIGRRCLTGDDLTWLPSLRSGHNDLDSTFDSLGALYTHGFSIDWAGFERPFGSRSRVAAPTYPFQRQRYWLEAPKQKRAGTAVKPLIDKVIRSPLIDAALFETEFSVEALPFLSDHRVYGAVVSPGSCQVALALNAAELSGGEHGGLLLEDVVLPQALVIPEGQARTVQAVFSTPKDSANGDAAGRQEFKIISFAPDADASGPQGADLSTHATGYVGAAAGGRLPAVDLAALRERCTQPVDLAAFYADSEAAQMVWGPSFRWLDEAWRSDGDGAEALARIVRPAAVGSVAGYALHPGLLDACFQVVAFAKDHADEMAVAFAFGALHLSGPAHGETWWCHVARTERSKFDIQLLDDGGEVVAAITGFQVRAASAAAIRGHEVWRKWLYAPQWEARAHFGQRPDYLPAPAALAAPLCEQAPAKAAGDAAGGEELAAALAQLSTAYIAAGFDKAGFRRQEGTHWRSEQIARQLGVIPSHRRLLERMLGLLAEGGLMEPAGDGWRLLRSPASLDAEAQLAAMQARWGDAPEVRLLARCGPRLSEVLRGVQEPLELLFPGGDFTDTMRLYAESPAAAVIAGLIREIAARLPAGRGVQIVEVGAGSGSATGAVLPLLPAGRSRYVFTDSDPTLLQKAQERFADYPFVEYAALNIEQGPQRQGFAGGQADVVLAANVLHATRDLGEALDNVRALLQPGGQLLLLANTTRAGWIDLTFGLLDSWWRYADSRQDHPLIGADEWKALLLAHGFAQVEVITVGPQSVLLAQADSAVRRAADKRMWLLLADRRGVGDRLAAALRAQGDRAVLAYAGGGWRQTDQDAFYLAPDHPADYRQLLLSLGAVDGVVHLWSLDADGGLDGGWDAGSDAGSDAIGGAVRRSAGSALLLVQALLQEQASPAGLWLVTQDAQGATADDPVSGAAQSGLWGMSRVITLEHPELNPVCIDLTQAEGEEAQAAHLYAEITGSVAGALARAGAAHERQIAMRPLGRYVARLQRFAGEAATGSTDPICRSDGTYLITGGLRGLGLAVAAGLADQGARRLVLLGRSAPKAEVQPQLDALAARGVHVTVAQCDVSDRDQLAAVLAGIDPAYPLRGVVHSAGVLDDGAIAQQSPDRFAKVFAPKVQGAWNLHELTQGIELDFFVLFSSASALLGNRGQSNYVAANAVLDAFAHYRRSRGLPALSINWGAWAEIGLAADLVRTQGAQLAAQGTGAIAPEQGVAAFVHLLGQGAPQVGVVPMQWPVFMQIGGADDAFYTAFRAEAAGAGAADAQPAATAAGAATQSIRRQLAEATPEQGRRLLLAYVQKEVAEALQMHELPAAQAGFNELGMDSLMTIDLRRRLEKALQLTLPSTIAFEYPTVEELAGYLAGVIPAEGPAPQASGAAPDAPAAADDSSAASAADDANNVGGTLSKLSEAELDKLLEQELAFLDEE